MRNHVYLEGYNIDNYVISLGNYTSSSNAMSGVITIPNITVTLNADIIGSFLTTTINNINVLSTESIRGKNIKIEYNLSYGTIEINGTVESFEVNSNQLTLNVQSSLISELNKGGILSSTGEDPFSLIINLVNDVNNEYMIEEQFIYWSTKYKALGGYLFAYYGSSDNKSKMEILNEIVNKSGALVGIESNKLVASMERNVNYTIVPCSKVENVKGNINYFNGYSVDFFGSGGALIGTGNPPIWRSSGGSNSNLQYSNSISAATCGAMKIENFPQSQVVKFNFLAEYPINLLNVYNIESDIFPRGRLIEYTLNSGFITGTFRAV